MKVRITTLCKLIAYVCQLIAYNRNPFLVWPAKLCDRAGVDRQQRSERQPDIGADERERTESRNEPATIQRVGSDTLDGGLGIAEWR